MEKGFDHFREEVRESLLDVLNHGGGQGSEVEGVGREAEVNGSGGEGASVVEFRSGAVTIHESVEFPRRVVFPCWACDVRAKGAAEEEVVEYGEGACGVEVDVLFLLGGEGAGLPFDQGGDLEVCEIVFGQVAESEAASSSEETPEMKIEAVIR